MRIQLIPSFRMWDYSLDAAVLVKIRGSQQWHPGSQCSLSLDCWWEGIMSWQGFFRVLEGISALSELTQLQGCSICMQSLGAADGWLLLLNSASFPEELRLSKCNNLSFLSQNSSQTTVKRAKSADKTLSLHLGYLDNLWSFYDVDKEKFKYLLNIKIWGEAREKISSV